MKQPSDPWQFLKEFTHARIALGRVGSFLPTQELLKFRMAHSRARDSVWGEIDFSNIREGLQFPKEKICEVQSVCETKKEFLLNPDKGRELNAVSLSALNSFASKHEPADTCLVLADGLSAEAMQKNGNAFCHPFIAEMRSKGLKLGSIVLAKYSRVALGDKIGSCLKARSVVVVIGERPGLASCESLSVYLTYQPSTSKTDAERNCISNIQSEGLSPSGAAQMAVYLLDQSLKKQLSGVNLKVEYPADLKKII